MINSIRNDIKSIFTKDKFSISSVVIFSITLFYILVTFYAISVFSQFNYIEIITVSLVFLILLIIMPILFSGNFFRQPLQFSLYNIFIAIWVLIIMLFLLNSLSFLKYYHLFPLLETELGLGWNQDTVFHLSLIQNILNFGYPSIGQHGTPIIIYHVLSHYMDALILLITGLEPYDSYGLFFYFKGFLFLSSITIFIAYVFKEFSGHIFILSLVLFAPIIISDWHGIGSHGLWLTTILLIFTLPKVFDITQLENIPIQSYLFLFLLIIFISLGKISTGFMYASFIGFILLMRRAKDIFVYILGIAWIGFFLVYSSLMVRNSDKLNTFDVSWLNFSYLYEHIININKFEVISINYEMQNSILISIVFFGLSFYIFRNIQNFYLFISSLISFIILIFITKINKNFSDSDIGYFYFGFISILILFIIYTLPSNIKIYLNKKLSSFSELNKRLLIVVLFFSAFYLSDFYTQPSFKLKSNFLMRDIAIIETKDTLLKTKVIFLKEYLVKIESRPLKVFRDELYKFMKLKQINKSQASLYIEKDIFKKMSLKFEGNLWANGMLVYAITGIPLVHGIQELQENYGYADYNKNSLWIEKNKFEPISVCKSISSDYIIIIESLFEPKFDLYRCDYNV